MNPHVVDVSDLEFFDRLLCRNCLSIDGSLTWAWSMLSVDAPYLLPCQILNSHLFVSSSSLDLLYPVGQLLTVSTSLRLFPDLACPCLFIATVRLIVDHQ